MSLWSVLAAVVVVGSVLVVGAGYLWIRFIMARANAIGAEAVDDMRSRMVDVSDAYDIRGGEGMRSSGDVFRTGLGHMLMSWTADAQRKGDTEVSGRTAMALVMLSKQGFDIAREGERSQVVLQEISDAVEGPTLDITPALRLQTIWLSASSDALLWATGVLDEVPEQDPDMLQMRSYQSLLHPIVHNDIDQLVSIVGLRPRVEIEAELRRWQQRYQAAEAGTWDESFAVMRTRALRWILEPHWTAVNDTPYVGQKATDFTPAAL